MSSLAHCLKKLGLSEHEAAILRGRVDSLRDDGYEAHEAAHQAISDHLDDLHTQRADVLAQAAAAHESASTAQPAAVQSGLAKMRAAKAATAAAPVEQRPPGQANNAYLKRLFRVHGIEIGERSDITGESGRGAHKTGAMPGTFRNNGMALDDWGEKLVTGGWLAPESKSERGNENLRASSEDVRAFVRRVLDGEHVHRLGDEQERGASEHSAWVEREAALTDGELSPLEMADLVDSGLTREQNEQAFDAAKMLADANYSQKEIESILERAALQSDDQSSYEQAVRAAAADRSDQARRRGAAEEAAGEAHPVSVAAEEGHSTGTEEGRPSLALHGESNAEVVARERAQRDADVASAERIRKSEAKGEADRERDAFALTGSDRAADTAAAKGQRDLLASQAAAIKPEPASHIFEAKAAETPQQIADFGEKIGGARKDVAKPLGPRANIVRQADERPVWARKYVAMQRVDPVTRQASGPWTLHIADRDGRAKLVSRTEYPTEAEALDKIPLAEVSRNHRVYSYKEGDATKFGIFRAIGDRKRALVKGGFASEDAAMREIASNPVPIIEHKFQFPEKPWLDRIERAGPDVRNGNVSPKDFQGTFGFRGGEFGNWNMGSDGQAALNHAYDSLVDLARVLKVPPKALSLNGELAIAFGARGHGGVDSASAHYERDYGVINLTKIRGAGSLAHEWFHALDHYLGRLDSKSSSEMTGGRFKAAPTPERDYLSHGASTKSAARPELIAAFKNVMDAMTVKEKGIPIEEASAQRKSTSLQDSMKYRLTELRSSLTDTRYRQNGKVATPAQLEQWDKLGARLMNGDGGDVVHVPPPKGARRLSFGHDSFAVIREMNDLYKSITGSSFDKADQHSRGREMYWGVKHMQEMKARIEKAQAGAIETRKFGTEYLNESKKIDDFRASAYWATRHEMGARAFESYIFDKLRGAEERSDYLTHAVENKYYAMLGMRPYPEGEERATIDKAFDRLFETVKTQETDKGTALFESGGKFPHLAFDAGMGEPEVKRIYAELTKAFGSAPPVNVAPLRDWPMAPKSERVQNAITAKGTIRGAFWRGEVWLDPEAITTKKAAAFVIKHELAHAGLDRLFKNQATLDATLKAIYDSNADIRAEADHLGERLKLSPTKATEEVIANRAGGSEWRAIKGVDRLIAQVRMALRRMGFRFVWSDNDVMNLIARTQETIERGSGAAAGEARLSVDAANTTAPNPNERERGPGGAPLYSGVERKELPRASAFASLQKIFAPASRGPIATLQANIMRDYFGRQARESEMANNAMRQYAKAFSKMPIADAVKFVDAYERGGVDKVDPALREAAQAMHDFNMKLVTDVQELGTGKLESFNENYLGRIWLDPKEKVNAVFARRPLEGSKGFLKRRVYQYFSQGLEAGLKPITYNPVEMMLLKGQEVRRYIYAQRIFGEMKEAGLVAKWAQGEAPAEWTAISDKIAQAGSERYYAPDEAATLLNNHLSPGLQGNGAYDAYHRAGMMLNSAQLGLSLFHLGFTTVDSMVSKAALGVQQLSRGQFLKGIGNVAQSVNPATPFLNAYKGDRLLRAYLGELKDPGLAPIVEALVHGGGRTRMDEFYRNATLNGFKQAIQRNDKLGAAKLFLPTVMDRINAPVFEQLVPRQKLGVFFDLAKDWLERNPNATLTEKREAMAKYWDSVDNRMGQLAYDNVFWNRTLKDALMVSVRSVGWNLGTFRELGGGVLDLKKIRMNRELSSRTAYVIALPFVTAVMGSIIGYLYTGKGPDELKDYFFPKTGRLRPDRTEDRVSLPSYMKDIFEYGHDISGFLKYGSNPTQTLQNKLHPLLGIISQMVNNKDFFGGAIRSPGDPIVQQLMDEAKYLGHQLEPFGARNYTQQAQVKGEEPTLVGYATSPSMIGVTPSPSYITKNDQQVEAAALGAQKDALIAKFRQELQNGANPAEMSRRMLAAGLRLPEVHMVLREGLSPVRTSTLPPRRLLPQVNQ